MKLVGRDLRIASSFLKELGGVDNMVLEPGVIGLVAILERRKGGNAGGEKEVKD